MSGVTAPQREGHPEHNHWVIIGWIAIFIFPVAAVVIGIIIWHRGDRRGMPIALVPVTLVLLGLVLALSISASGPNTIEPAPGVKEVDCTFDSKPTAKQRERCIQQGGFTVHPD